MNNNTNASNSNNNKQYNNYNVVIDEFDIWRWGATSKLLAVHLALQFVAATITFHSLSLSISLPFSLRWSWRIG